MLVSRRYTIGFLSSWHVYEGAAIEPFSHSLIRGVCSAAVDFSCNLLLACGVGPIASERIGAAAWPVLEEKNACFVPVGPWNTDGLVVLPTELTVEQSAYLQNLRGRGFPIVFAGPGENGISVVVDNEGGIRQAVDHLVEHGRRNIALIAGLQRSSGDSYERREAYSRALRENGIHENPALVAYGMHSFTGGQAAMRQILAVGDTFDAVIASNDRSAMGAIRVLQEQHLLVPDDVAVIGFDDIPEAKACSPAITTLRNSSFMVGYQAALRLLDEIEGRNGSARIVIPVPLIARQSCGCDPLAQQRLPIDFLQPAQSPPPTGKLATALTEAVMRDVLYISRTKVSNSCHALALNFNASIREHSPERFSRTLAEILDQTEEQEDDVLAWNNAVSVLRDSVEAHALPPAQASLVAGMLDSARLDISERARRIYARNQFQKAESTDRLSLMAAQLLTVLDEKQVRDVLDVHFQPLGIERMLALLLRSDETDPAAQSEVLHSYGFSRDLTGSELPTRQFPPAGWFPAHEPYQLALLPLSIPGRLVGYTAFQTKNIAQLAVIVRSLESALRTSYLYADAVQGRLMAEEANQMKTRFLSMVSHELRTPLNVIVGLSEIMLRQEGEKPGAGYRQDVERIFSNAQHLSRLIGDVLDLVSSGSGQLQLFREPLDLAEVLRPVIAAGEQLAQAKGLAWRADLPERGPYVMGDRTRLRQAALNLVSNAVKFTAQGVVSMDLTVTQDEVTVSVQDTGIGIPLEDQPKLFSEFGQSKLSISKGLGGMGLGLAITRELIERQGGRIGMVSAGREGEGSTFFFSMPVLAFPGVSAEPPHQPGAFSRVLLLTCQPVEAGTLAGELRKQGYLVDVHEYINHTDSLLPVFENPPGAVILDESLAASESWRLLSWLKQNPATRNLPVLVCAIGEHRAGEVLELNYQMKPLTPGQIAQALAAHSIQGAASTILIVDDDPGIRSYHARIVRQNLPECRIVEAENGQVALDYLRDHRPDLVLLDLIMPVIDGFGVLAYMHQQELTRDVPVIILTGKTITDDDILQLNRGVAAVLTKGLFNSQETIHHIEQALQGAPGLGTSSQRLVRRAVSFIQEHFAESLTRDQIAEYVSVTPDHLSDCFHQELGITPIAYLNRYRIFQARKLLEEGARSITQVALDVGFSDSAHFSRVFQREVGASPRHYQRSRGQ